MNSKYLKKTKGEIDSIIPNVNTNFGRFETVINLAV